MSQILSSGNSSNLITSLDRCGSLCTECVFLCSPEAVGSLSVSVLALATVAQLLGETPWVRSSFYRLNPADQDLS